MKSSNFAVHRCAARRAPLAMCLSVALTLSQSTAIAALPTPPATPRVVKNCDDPGDADSLRQVVASAQSGDTIDLGKLPHYCAGSDTANVTIALSGTEIETQVDLTLQGPDAGHGTVTVSGGGASRVLNAHAALALADLTIADGHVEANSVGGGCIRAGGPSLSLILSTVTGCSITGADVYGGGVAAVNYALLRDSTISNNTLTLQGGVYGGGGLFAGSLAAKYSDITGNVVSGTGFVSGGGALVTGDAYVFSSTIDHNHVVGGPGGGLALWSSTEILNSTISSNTADQDAITLEGNSVSLSITSSTIALNHATGDNKPAGITLGTVTTGVSSFDLESSIVAMNTAGSANVESDLFSYHPLADPSLSGSHNIVLQVDASITPPTGFVVANNTDPKLGPLAFNGGPTRTHALLPGSPALGQGGAATATYDQRGKGYSRSTTTAAGTTTDVGAYEFDSIFVDGLE